MLNGLTVISKANCKMFMITPDAKNPIVKTNNQIFDRLKDFIIPSILFFYLNILAIR